MDLRLMLVDRIGEEKGREVIPSELNPQETYDLRVVRTGIKIDLYDLRAEQLINTLNTSGGGAGYVCPSSNRELGRSA